MTYNTNDVIVGAVLLTLTFALIFYTVMRYFAQKRRKVLDDYENPSWSDDVAHNQIVTTRVLIDRAEKNGGEVRLARERLKEAEARERAGSHREAANLARASRDLIDMGGSSPSVATKRRIPVERNRTLDEDSLRFRDLSKPVGHKEELEVLPVPPEGESADEPGAAQDVAPMQEFRKSVGKNYLESRFELEMLGSDLKSGEGPNTDEAQKLLTAAQKAHDREDYTECLRLALRGRRVLGPAGLQTVALSPATVVESPPTEPLPSAKRSSAPSRGSRVTVAEDTGEATSTVVKCPRCGKDNPSQNRFCRGCGLTLNEAKCPRCQVKVSLEDTFCGGCGAPLSAMG